MTDYEISNLHGEINSDEDVNPLVELSNFNQENAKRQRLIASLDKLISSAEGSGGDYGTKIEYRMTTEEARLILDSLKASTDEGKGEAEAKEEKIIDGVFPIKSEHFWDFVDATDTDKYNNINLKFGEVDESEYGRYALEVYKKYFGKEGFNTYFNSALRRCENIILDILSEHSETPDLIEGLGLTDKQKNKLAAGLVIGRAVFMSEDILHSPEKFADFVERYNLQRDVITRYERYYDYERMLNGKSIHYHPSVLKKIGCDDLSDDCKSNLPKMLKNLENYFDLTMRDFDDRIWYYILDGYLATESDHELCAECPLTLCDKNALDKLSFWKSYDEDYEVRGFKFARKGDGEHREWLGSGEEVYYN